MSELFPIATGLILGSTLALVRPRIRLAVGVAGSVVLGTIATVVSGEYKIGWEFLLIDIPLVAVCSAAGLASTRVLGRKLAGSRTRTL